MFWQSFPSHCEILKPGDWKRRIVWHGSLGDAGSVLCFEDRWAVPFSGSGEQMEGMAAWDVG